MPQDPDIPPNGFVEILDWLDPDREKAAAKYEELRRSLIKIFAHRMCADPEGMADEVFERVAEKVHYLRPDYKGDPKLYFYGVARNLGKEYPKTTKSHVSIDDIDPAGGPRPDDEVEEPDHEEECLHLCLDKLSSENRALILEYYAKERQKKIDQRKEMAERLGITILALRVRMFRIRGTIETCIEHCMEQFASSKEMD
jgi:RNA polymerase sigma factor (sigma-70 family)